MRSKHSVNVVLTRKTGISLGKQYIEAGRLTRMIAIEGLVYHGKGLLWVLALIKFFPPSSSPGLSRGHFTPGLIIIMYALGAVTHTKTDHDLSKK